MEITTNQPAVQVYTGYWLDTPRKAVHGGPDVNYTKWSAVAIEQEGYIDAINTPEWGVDQICEPTRIQIVLCGRILTLSSRGVLLDYPGKDYEWESVYRFSTVP